jgi:hypothetical protein
MVPIDAEALSPSRVRLGNRRRCFLPSASTEHYASDAPEHWDQAADLGFRGREEWPAVESN